MKTFNSKNQFAKFHEEDQFALNLIREELKIRKFFNTLRELGIEDCYYELILKSLGLNDGTDETYYRFSDLMDKHSKKIKADQDSIMKQAVRIYKELILSRES